MRGIHPSPGRRRGSAGHQEGADGYGDERGFTRRVLLPHDEQLVPRVQDESAVPSPGLLLDP